MLRQRKRATVSSAAAASRAYHVIISDPNKCDGTSLFVWLLEAERAGRQKRQCTSCIRAPGARELPLLMFTLAGKLSIPSSLPPSLSYTSPARQEMP